MTSIKILIDNNNDVYAGHKMFGSGEPAFQRALQTVPLSRFNTVYVEDERGDYGQVKSWTFNEPYSFESLSEAVATTEPERVDVVDLQEVDYMSLNDDYEGDQIETDFDFEDTTATDAEQLSSEEWTNESESPAPDLGAMDEAYEYMQRTSYVDDDALFPGQGLSEREYSRPQEIRHEELSLAEKARENGYTDAYSPYHVDGEDEAWFPEHKDYSFSITQMPEDVSRSQYYGPGERTTNVPIAIKRSPITANKVQSKTPIYAVLVILGLILIGLLIRWIASPPPTEWSAVCYDQRTEIVLEKNDCSTKQNPYASVGYVQTSDLGKAKPKSHLPKNYKAEEPSGNVEVDTNL